MKIIDEPQPLSVMRSIITTVLLITTHFTFADSPFVRNGEADFVVSHIEFALSIDEAASGACPQGMSLNLAEIYALSAEGKRSKEESDQEYMDRLQAATRRLGTNADGRDTCMHPETAAPDPYFRTVQSSVLPVYGIDLDGRQSANDFQGMNGQWGVDNQWYRVAGCSRSWQPSGQSNKFNITMLTGSWGILVSLKGIDDIRNDEQVKVTLYANADPIRLSPSRVPVSYASYSPLPDSRFRAVTTGSISNGVLTTKPVDARFLSETNSMYLERPLRDARLQVTLSEHGELSGYLSGYMPVQALYDMKYGFRSGKTANGEPSAMALRSGSANGAAFVLGHTCHGAYHALQQNADGHPDLETGKYTSISTQYRISAIPAFVIEQEINAGTHAKGSAKENSGEN